MTDTPRDKRTLDKAYDDLLEDFTNAKFRIADLEFENKKQEERIEYLNKVYSQNTIAGVDYKQELFEAQAKEAELLNRIDILTRRVEGQSLKVLKLKKELQERKVDV